MGFKVRTRKIQNCSGCDILVQVSRFNYLVVIFLFIVIKVSQLNKQILGHMWYT